MNSATMRALIASIALLTTLASAEEAAVKPDLTKEADKQIARLDSNDFDERESALKKLQEMDPEVLTYLKGLVEGRRSLSEEVRGRLGMVVSALEEKRERTLTAKGSAVTLRLTKAGPKEILQELAKQAHAEPLADFEKQLQAEPAADFAFTGSYWEAIGELLRVFPPKDNGKWEREDLAEPRTLSHWTAADYDACAMPHAIAGVCRIRVGRVALERNAKGQALTLVLVPQVEPRYEVDKIEVQVDTFTLTSGKVLKPKWTFQPRANDPANANANPLAINNPFRIGADTNGPSGVFLFSPQSECFFAAPAAELLNGDRLMNVEGSLSMTLHESNIQVKTMREVSTPINLANGYTFSVHPVRDGIEVQISGGGNVRELGRQLQDRVRFLDANDAELDSQITNTSVRGGVQGFCLVEKVKVMGNPAKVRVSIPSKARDVTVPFTIKNVALPVAGDK